MKVALDPWMVRNRSLDQMCQFAAETGYQWVELSPREDFLPLFVAPRADPEHVKELKRSLQHHGVSLASLWTVYRWSEPNDVEAREMAVRYWKRAIQIAADLECSNLNSEFSGRPEFAEKSEASFWRSMEELAPILEREKITMNIEPHPDDFVEDGNAAVDIIRALGSPQVRYLYCAPHTFHMGGDMSGMIHYAASTLGHVHVADTLDHRIPARYIVNPPDLKARVHQHTNIGEGELDWDTFFRTLQEIGFDGILTSAVFAWPDRAEQSARIMLEQINRYLTHYPPIKKD